MDYFKEKQKMIAGSRLLPFRFITEGMTFMHADDVAGRCSSLDVFKCVGRANGNIVFECVSSSHAEHVNKRGNFFNGRNLSFHVLGNSGVSHA